MNSQTRAEIEIEMFQAYDHRPEATFKNDSALSLMIGVFDAVTNGDIDAIRNYLNKGADINQKDAMGDTLLHYTVSLNQVATTLWLLSQNNVLPDERNDSGRSPVSLAAELGQDNVIASLLKAEQCDLGSMDRNGITPLGHAVLQERCSTVCLLWEPKKNQIYSLACGFYTPLYIAVYRGNKSIVETFTSWECLDTNHPGFGDAETITTLAARRNYPEILTLLLDKGFETSSYLMYMAASCGSDSVVETLIDRGFDLNKACVGISPIKKAAFYDHVSTVDTLLRRGAKTSLESLFYRAIRDGAVKTMAYLLFWSNAIPAHRVHEISRQFLRDIDPSLLERLFSGSISTKKFQVDKEYALYYACSINKEGPARLLLECGCDVKSTKPFRYNKTPLHEASQWGFEKMVQLLLDYESPVDAQDINGNTPLHLAALKYNYAGIYVGNHFETVKLLLDRGSDINARNTKGQTALHIAVRSAEPEIVQLLLSQGANIHDTDDDGHDALYNATSAVELENIKLLKESGASFKSTADLDSLLLKCCSYHEPSLVRFMIDEGANVNYISPDLPSMPGLSVVSVGTTTPLIQAIFCGSMEVLELLIERGADVNICGTFRSPDQYTYAYKVWRIFNGTPLEIAIYMESCNNPLQRKSITELLRKHGAIGDYSSFQRRYRLF